jgi:hypothetical protein
MYIFYIFGVDNISPLKKSFLLKELKDETNLIVNSPVKSFI